MVLQSTRWLALGYFTYFFSYGIFLPFWSVWLKGIGLTPETIGLLLGAGHAGIEAALAAARLGCNTVVFTINLDAVGNCPCNPSIGGTAKGHLVREVDALGGEMGKTADESLLQMPCLFLWEYYLQFSRKKHRMCLCT